MESDEMKTIKDVLTLEEKAKAWDIFKDEILSIIMSYRMEGKQMGKVEYFERIYGIMTSLEDTINLESDNEE